jgi:rare lipoprotein A (peptidoglycan hydrolase)
MAAFDMLKGSAAPTKLPFSTTVQKTCISNALSMIVSVSGTVSRIWPYLSQYLNL